MKKTGKVVNVKDNKVYILTEDKEFAVVKLGSELPIKGRNYSGFEFVTFSKHLKLLIFFIMMISIASSIYYIKYTSSDSSFIVDYKARFSISVNSKNKIVSIKGLNKSAERIITANSFMNKDYNDVLKRIFSICIAKDFFEGSSNSINIQIDNKDDSYKIDFSNFNEFLKSRDFKLIVNDNGTLVQN